MKSPRKLGAALALAAGTLSGSAALAAPEFGPPLAPVAAPALVAAPAPAAKPASSGTPNWLRPAPKVAATTALATNSGPSPLRIGGMLALVATLGGVAYYAQRRRRPAPAGAPKQQPRVLGSTRIGPKATAVVVEIAGKRILLGVTEHSVNNLAWLDDDASQAVEEEVSSLRTSPAVRPSLAPENAGPSGFLKLLRNAVGSGTAEKIIASDEVARSTRDEVRLSKGSARRERRAAEDFDDEMLEGQVMGLVKRRKEQP